MQGSQVHLDACAAVLTVVKAGQMTAAEASECLERSPHWVWAALAPPSPRLGAITGGARTLARAQRLVHQVVEGRAPGGVPRVLTDGLTDDRPALRTHGGPGVQPPRQRAAGPAPKPRWRPLPHVRDAQVVTSDQRRVIRVRPRVVVGTVARVNRVLEALGWQIHTACMARANRAMRRFAPFQTHDPQRTGTRPRKTRLRRISALSVNLINQTPCTRYRDTTKNCDRTGGGGIIENSP